MDDLIHRLSQLVETWRDNPFLPLILVGMFVVFGILHLSPWLLVLQTGAMLRPPLSCAVAFAGMNISAGTFYVVGRFLERFVKRFVGERGKKIVENAGFEGVFFLRVLPVLPYSLINMSAGAFGMRYRTFGAATALGVLPGVLILTILGDRAMKVILNPTPRSIATLVAVVLALLVSVTGLRLWLKKRNKIPNDAAPPSAPKDSA
jgi:uncharacterized membrane protein YdjX (TVP38/TMEM64 family)